MLALALLRRLDLTLRSRPGVFILFVLMSVAWTYAFVIRESNHTERMRLEAVIESLKNPKVERSSRESRNMGQVTIRTIIRERPAGEKETRIEEVRAPIVETKEEVFQSRPESIDFMSRPAARSDRFLIGAGLRDWSPKNLEAYTFYGGYSIGNRIDLLAGLGRSDEWHSDLMVVFRF